MNRVKIYIISVILLMLVVLIYYYAHAIKETLTITNGEVDLTQTDFDEKGMIALDGEWELYWNQLLNPDDFLHEQHDVQYALVPGNWLNDLNGNTYDATGYATYRMVVRNIPLDTKYFGILKGNIRNASQIFVNGEIVLKDGEVSETLDGNVSGNNSKAAYFEVKSSTAEIIIQAANHDYIVGGIAKPITFGTQKEIIELHQQKIMFEFSMILIVVIIGLFYLFLCLVNKEYRKKEPATLPLALSCLFYGVMSSIYSERIITVIFPSISMDSTFRFGHLISAFTVITVLIVVNKVSSVFLSNRIRNVMLVFYSVFVLITLLFPLATYSKILVFYMIYTVLFYFIIWIKVLFLFIKRNGSNITDIEHIAMIISICSIYLFWFDMILYSVGLKIDMFISFLTIPIYSIAFSVLLIFRYTYSYKKNEELSNQLIETFSTLDQTVKKAEKNELAFLQAQIKPHFLFNTLSSIISLCYTDGNRAGEVLSNLSNYLKRSFQVDIQADYVTIENELKLIEAYIDIETVRFGDRINMIYDVDEEVLSFKIIPLVIEPLIENAIRHGVLKNKSGGEVKLTLKRKEHGVYIGVEDNGKGIDVYQMNAIRNGDRNVQSLSGNGISLANIYTRLQNFYHVELQFETGHTGTKVYFTIPLNHDKEEVADD
ncbi:histidine kinase [Sporosarcina sp. GW1-11]|uniref:sensor histidine kinase n=1 Tax=Sporosarcina sp. GW1-11 TaxID=2899126 RepID=UPI00294EE7ED|nr:histidine kinase [Sporosarcina sp. GW1-11]MDV6378197.1 histidine kinase [Sporosarcina sp. GW1-11]